jgi:hypothetical protein
LSDEKKYRPGTIIWAWVKDQSGQNIKSRPLVVLRDGPSGQLECVCITTKIMDVPIERVVQVPHVDVGLPDECVAHTGWIRFVEIDSIEKVMPSCLPRVSFEAIARKLRR